MPMTAALILSVERIATPTGKMTLVTDEQLRLCSLDWEDHEHRMQNLLRRYFPGEIVELQERTKRSPVVDALLAYFENEPETLARWPVATHGTDFQHLVWAELRRIPFGETISYGTLAARIGRPAAVRAVGLANGANPIAISVPCHRVIGADKSLTGFGGGIERKRWLLEYERRAAGKQDDLFSASGTPRVLNPRTDM